MKGIKILLASLLLIGSLFVFTTPLPASADLVDSQLCQGAAADSTVCQSKSSVNNNNPIFGPNGVLTTIINIISLIVGIVAVIMIIVGGLRFVTGGNNPQDVEKARNTIIYAIAGLVIALLAQAIVQLFLKRIE